MGVDDSWFSPFTCSRGPAFDSTGAGCTDLDSPRLGERPNGLSMYSLNYGPGAGAFDGPSRALLYARGSYGSAASLYSSSTLSSTLTSTVSTMSADLVWPVFKVEHTCTSEDGIRLHATRARCPAAAALCPRAHPVLLVPGLASSGAATFDITPDFSLVDHLARMGYDVWFVDLRGNGRSDAPKTSLLGDGWCVDDHLFQDLPALVSMVLQETGAQQLHWVGHSMGGMLAAGALSLQGFLSRHIRSVIMLGSGCFGAGSWHSALKPLVLVLCGLGFPGSFAGAFMGRLVGTQTMSLIESAFYWRSNMEVHVAKKLMSSCFRFIPASLINQFMRTMHSDAGLTTNKGMRYCDPKVLQHVRTPVLGITGDWDLFCPAPGSHRTVQQFGGDRRFIFLGPAWGTTRSHYGHFDVIMGANARDEVWPHLTAFLAEQDAKAGAAAGAAPPVVTAVQRGMSDSGSFSVCSDLTAPSISAAPCGPAALDAAAEAAAAAAAAAAEAAAGTAAAAAAARAAAEAAKAAAASAAASATAAGAVRA